jgi:hypothetical protein
MLLHHRQSRPKAAVRFICFTVTSRGREQRDHASTVALEQHRDVEHRRDEDQHSKSRNR